MDSETLQKLEYCMQVLHLTKAEVLRKGVEQLYDRIKKRG